MKKGFTLAEVLITLGIIGIIAAMTLPSLIGNYKKKVLQNQFKVAYSLFQQAYLKIQADWGYTPNCYYWDKNPYGGNKCIAYNDRGGCIKWGLTDGSELPKNYNGNMEECKIFYEALEKTLQVINKCENKAFEKGCIPEYEGIDTVNLANNPDMSDDEAYASTSGCDNFRKTNILNKTPAFVLKNGMIMIPYSISGLPIFLLDINGKKSPNKWGHDLFAFRIHGNTNLQLNLTYSTNCAVVEKGGLSTKQMIENMYLYNNKYTK